MHPEFAEDLLKIAKDERIVVTSASRKIDLRFLAMPQDASAQFVEAERAELERVVSALSRWPRLSHLLAYMGEKLSAGDADQLNEYNIATEVLGRSKTVFSAAEDAIARVETHRLRKRLAEFYENEGRDHSIQVTLPAGSYVPIFIHKPEGSPSRVSPDLQMNEPALSVDKEQIAAWSVRRWKNSILAAVLLIGVGAYLYIHTREFSAREKTINNQVPAAASLPIQPGSASSGIRLLAGYSGPPRIDSAGLVWNPDQYFSAGGIWQRTGPIARTSRPFLFEHSRTGDFSYNIPLKPGLYELHLFFSTPSSEAVTTFNVSMSGDWVLMGFDINMDALGQDVADERVFRGVSPGKDGFLRIGFSGALGPPMLNAIEILPTPSRAQLPIRLIMQTTPFTDSKGQLWLPDDYFMNGHSSKDPQPLLDSSDPDLFAGERFGHFTYAVPVDTRDTYTVVLHFAEFYFSAAASGDNGRLFKVMCNGQTLLDNFDIFKEAGKLREVTKTFRHLKPTAQGKLNLTFEPVVNNATVSGIEVLDEFR